MAPQNKIIKGLAWSSLAQTISQVCQFTITAVLAHLLSPSDFGLFGMVTVFTGFATIVGELGIGGAIIQSQRIDECHYSSVFWFNVVIGLSLTVIFVLIAPLIARFYERPEIIPILTIVSLNFFLSSFTIIQQAVLMKAMDFKSLALRDIFAVTCSGTLGILSASRGYGVWSLVIQLLAYTATNNLLLWISSEWRPKWIFSFTSIKEIFPFSAHVTGFQLVNYFARNMDYLLIGKVLGSEALGYYTLAYKLMMFPLQNITWIVNKVMFPALSKMQEEMVRFRRNYLYMVKSVALLSFPIMAYLFVIAPDIIQLVYGSNWKVAIPLVRIFCFCGMVQSITSLGGTIYLAKGRADLQFKMSLISTFMLLIVLYIAVYNGIEAVAFAYTSFYLIWANISIFVVAKLISQNILKIYKIASVPFMFSIVLIIILTSITKLIYLGPLLKIVSFAAISFITYAFMIILSKQVIIKKHCQFDLGEV